MNDHNHLGLYISADGATAVCLGSQGREKKLLGCFSISLEQQQHADWHLLTRLLADGCEQGQLAFSEVTVALDCAMFMQHNVHTEFTDPKQIASTVRFDTEEALASDISDVTLAFKINSTDQAGSLLTVFTAQRKILSEILSALQGNGLDPVTMEPDVGCLAGFIQHTVTLDDGLCPLFAVLARRNGYFLAFTQSQQTPTMRTVLLGPGHDSKEVLEREVPLTSSLLAGHPEDINCLKIFDSAGTVNSQQLDEKLRLKTSSLDLTGAAGIEPHDVADCADPVDFAIAYGAALTALEKLPSINFRDDFSPFQGRKLRLLKALKFLSIAVSVLLAALGVYVQLQLAQKSKYRSRLREKFTQDYLAVMLNERKLPARTRDAVRKLGSEFRRIENEKKGLLSITGKKAVSAKLLLLLEAFNKCAAQTDLQIDSVSITGKSISIAGSTSSRPNTLKLRNALKQTRLGTLQERLQTKGKRDSFNLTMVPEK